MTKNEVSAKLIFSLEKIDFTDFLNQFCTGKFTILFPFGSRDFVSIWFKPNQNISVCQNETKHLGLSQLDIKLNLPMVLQCLMAEVVQVPHAPILSYGPGYICHDATVSPLSFM